MIWLTWRQSRIQAGTIYAAIAVIAAVLAATGGQVAHLYRSGVATFFQEFTASRTNTTLYYVGVAAVLVVPAVIGAFWGAPLIAREVETGTHRLVWNQTITRRRWLAAKLGFTGLASIAAAGLLSLAVTWWCSPIDRAIDNGHAGSGIFTQSRLATIMFDARGIAPIGYAAFAFTLGVTAGLVLRRTVPAMAVTLAVFVVAQIVMPLWIRPHLIPPVRTTVTITADNLQGLESNGPNSQQHLVVNLGKPGSWVVTDQTIDRAGHVVATLPVPAQCARPQPGGKHAGPPDCLGALTRKITQLGYRQRIAYQPTSRYWALQSCEMGVFLAASGLLIGFCFWRIRRIS
jgi:hypothetical protein